MFDRKKRENECKKKHSFEEFDLYHEVEGEHFLHLSRIDLNSSEHNLGFVIGKGLYEL